MIQSKLPFASQILNITTSAFRLKAEEYQSSATFSSAISNARKLLDQAYLPKTLLPSVYPPKQLPLRVYLRFHLFFFKTRERKKIKAEASTILAPGAISY